jgi:N-acetylglucosaminyl-diphospho-decaprenol L-rhamnosyltransferase
LPDIFNISIVSYSNVFDELKRCLDSISRQSVNTEVIIIDNLGSDDLKIMTEKYENTKYYSLPNPGFGAAHNFASDLFKHKGYRVFLNPDIILRDECLEQILTYFCKYPEISLLSPMLTNTDHSLQHFVRSYPSFPNMIKRIFKIDNDILNHSQFFTLVDYIHGAFFVLNKNANSEIQYDERYFLYLEDIDLCITAKKFGHVCVANRAFAMHSHQKASHHSLRLLCVHLNSFIKFWYKHGFFKRRSNRGI